MPASPHKALPSTWAENPQEQSFSDDFDEEHKPVTSQSPDKPREEQQYGTSQSSEHVEGQPQAAFQSSTKGQESEEHQQAGSTPSDDGSTSQRNSKMDPFEVRIRFTNHLQHLNASITSSQKAAQYALKYRDMDEDLHSCILEQLERNNMNNRANIMYFIEILCDMASKEGHQDYVRMMQRDILRVVDAVAPEDGSGAANVKVVRKVLQGLQQKNFLLAQTVLEIEDCLKERDSSPDHVGLSSPLQSEDVEMTGVETGAMAVQKPKQPQSGMQKLDKKQTEQRIEEDRERHKRLRENIWAVPPGIDAEFDKLWEETSDLGEDDFILMQEEAAERKACAAEWKADWERMNGPNPE